MNEGIINHFNLYKPLHVKTTFLFIMFNTLAISFTGSTG